MTMKVHCHGNESTMAVAILLTCILKAAKQYRKANHSPYKWVWLALISIWNLRSQAFHTILRSLQCDLSKLSLTWCFRCHDSVLTLLWWHFHDDVAALSWKCKYAVMTISVHCHENVSTLSLQLLSWYCQFIVLKMSVHCHGSKSVLQMQFKKYARHIYFWFVKYKCCTVWWLPLTMYWPYYCCRLIALTNHYSEFIDVTIN